MHPKNDSRDFECRESIQARSKEAGLLDDDGVDPYLRFNRIDENLLAQKIYRYVDALVLILSNRYQRPIAHSH